MPRSCNAGQIVQVEYASPRYAFLLLPQQMMPEAHVTADLPKAGSDCNNNGYVNDAEVLRPEKPIIRTLRRQEQS